MSSIPKMQSAIPNFKNPTSHQIKDPYKVAINRNLPLTSSQKRVLLYLLEKYNPFLENNIFPENATIALDLGLTESYVKDIRRELNKGGWIFTINTYKVVNNKMVQISNRYKLPDTILTYGTPDYGPALEAVLKYQAEHVNPSVAMAKGMSAQEAFKTCKGYEILNPSHTWSKPKLVESPKEEFTQSGGQPGQHLILKTISPTQKNNIIDHKPSFVTKPSFKGGFNNYTPIANEMYEWLKPYHERFDLLLGIKTPISQRRKQAGIMASSRCNNGMWGLCKEKLLHYSQGFTRSMDAIESCPTIMHSEEKSLGRLYEWVKLERAARGQNSEVNGLLSLVQDSPISAIENLGVYSVQKRSDPEKVVRQVLGNRLVDQYLALPQDEQCPYDNPEIIYTEEPKQRYQYV